MSSREVIFLGTASQVPTRKRNHNALFLRWDNMGILFDPGEGTQRQMLRAGLATSQITHICITHFHGDHCLGLAAMVQRISLDRVPHTIPVIYPQSGQVYYERLRQASIFQDHAKTLATPVRLTGAGLMPILEYEGLTLSVAPLDHRVDCFGYRLQEPDGRKMLPEKLEEYGIRGADIGKLIKKGEFTIEGKRITLDMVSEYRQGQAFAMVMDTRPCTGANLLAQNADLMVCESTYLSSEAQEAHEHYHMTAQQAAQLAKKAKVRRLALTHFSQRYLSLLPFGQEARAIHDDVFVAEDLKSVAVPKRPER